MRRVDAAVKQADARCRDAQGPRDARLPYEQILRDLMHRQEQLESLHARIATAQGDARARLWQRFFLRYDDFIMALQVAHRGGATVELAAARSIGAGARPHQARSTS